MSVQTARRSRTAIASRPPITSSVRRRWVLPGRAAALGTAAILQVRDDAPGGLMLDALAARGLTPATVRVDRDEPLPDPASLRFAVLLGTGNSVVYNRASRWQHIALEWLAAADRAGTPVLGLGSGAHTLAIALGGGVEPAPRPRRGWIRVETSAPDMVARGPWLAWNEGVIRLPTTASVLAQDHVGPQAFSVGRHVGVQFHPEVKPETVAGWVGFRRGEPLDGQAVLEATSRERVAAAAAAGRLFSAFIDSAVRRRP